MQLSNGYITTDFLFLCIDVYLWITFTCMIYATFTHTWSYISFCSVKKKKKQKPSHLLFIFRSFILCWFSSVSIVKGSLSSSCLCKLLNFCSVPVQSASPCRLHMCKFCDVHIKKLAVCQLIYVSECGWCMSVSFFVTLARTETFAGSFVLAENFLYK